MDIKNYLDLAESYVISAGGVILTGNTSLEKKQRGNVFSFRLCNIGNEPLRINEIVLFDGAFPFPDKVRLYGEGYSKLSRYAGTVDKFEKTGSYSDAGHYRLVQKEGFNTAYNLLLTEEEGSYVLIGFTSCRRFSGELRFNRERLQIVLKTENMTINPKQTWELEGLFADCGTERELLFERFGDIIQKNHPMLETKELPFGWCSWLAYGPEITETDIIDNMNALSERLPRLKYVQIDDGYQAHMGDWLECCDKFKDMRALCRRIKESGFEPAIWVAPFIAERNSALFKEHPDWFVKDDEGKPVPSDRYSFGGWRCGPWYMLDGTHPGAQQYLKHVFSVMRNEWGCRYFKLDANMWGAMPFGRRYDPEATSVEGYRRGMAAVLEGAGEDSFLLGCNAPMWPSLGVVHGMRVTDDEGHSWKQMRKLSLEGFPRNWQHNRLWLNDPDCLLLNNMRRPSLQPDGSFTYSKADVTETEFRYHAAYILAVGGLVLSGDIISCLSDKDTEIINKILDNVGKAAVFEDDAFRVGRTERDGKTLLFFFNPTDEPLELCAKVNNSDKVRDFWSEEEKRHSGTVTVTVLPRDARIFEVYTA